MRGDVPIPPEMTTVATFLSKDEFLLIVYLNLRERDNQAAFYRCKLKSSLKETKSQ